MSNFECRYFRGNLGDQNNGESDKFNRSDIYHLTSPDGGKKYNGQTGRSFLKRYNEHL
jgi:hypothetical protein